MLLTLSAPLTAVAAPPPAAERAADDFRRSDPEVAGLAAVASSSGMEHETAVSPRGRPLSLAEVLDGLADADPRLVAAEREIDGASGKLLAARGAFDTRLGISASVAPLGSYRNGVVDVKLEQATPLWGLSLWAGWRVGLGEFAGYDEKLATADGGELRAGLRLPLWQGRSIDRGRADVRTARAGRAVAEGRRTAKQLELEQAAAAAYWAWVSSGLILDIERELLELALLRDLGLRRKIELGELEPIIGIDNRRLILDREARVVAAEREFQAAALELALFHRDESGAPRVAGAEQLPQAMPQPSAPQVVDIDAEIEAALTRRPELAVWAQRRVQAEVELELARNTRGPRVDLSTWAAQDLGVGATPVELVAMVEVELPIPLRRGRGLMESAQAELARVDAELRLARDRVALGIRDAHSELAAAYQRARLSEQQVGWARALAEAEWRQFELGAGDLLDVNLRELAVVTARRDRVSALADVFVATARLEVALGRTVSRELN